jgi:hypothetical protein
MALTTRMVPANGATGGQVVAWCGPGDIGGIAARRYYNAGGTFPAFVDVAGDPSCDASQLVSQNFVIVGASGPTSVRPTAPGAGWLRPGLIFVDTSLNLVEVWDGFAWKNVLTGALV